MIWYKRIKERIIWEIEDVKSWWNRWEGFFLGIFLIVSIILVIIITGYVLIKMIKYNYIKW